MIGPGTELRLVEPVMGCEKFQKLHLNSHWQFLLVKNSHFFLGGGFCEIGKD